ncbi:MAG TPA: response regulator [Thermoanaerobaculaceae bacterium]|nr:response regulator [Thermoanaerobaculaceae bacterium]
MIDPDLADLVPLFVSEARGRIEKLASLVPRLDEDAAATIEVRRELHTLKGAGRMLRLAAFAELCHAAEGAMQPPRPGVERLLTRVVDRLAAMVDTLAGGQAPTPDEAMLRALAGDLEGVRTPTAAPVVVAPQPVPAAGAATGDLRLDSASIDEMADRATRLRILTLGAGHQVKGLYDLARLAEQGVREPQPRQVLAVLATTLRRLAMDLERSQQRLRRSAETQLESFLALQVQPLRPVLQSLARHARELASSLGREVEVTLDGEDTQLDRRITRELEEALLHLVRNAVDHGIEPTAAREHAGKPRVGRLHIMARSAGQRVRLSIADDGAGVDPARVAEAAVAAGLVDAPRVAAMSREEVLRLLFAPGFSTRDEVSEVSGRGIGLDAVAAIAERVGGGATITSQPGTGTTVTIEVPITRRGAEVLVVKAGNLRLALPSSGVQRIDRLEPGMVVERDGRSFARLRGELLPFLPLARTLGETPAQSQLLLQGEVLGQPLRVAVDEVEGSEEVLVRPAGRAAGAGPLLDGVALLASGQPVGVLSPKAMGQRDWSPRPAATAPRAAPRRLRVLLVDDSLVTREMERRLLEDAGFLVVTAGDALEGLAHLGEAGFDCLVTDIEMPGMDGFELTRHIRTMPHLTQLPVVVVSTRDRPEDRLRGLEAGADAYITKQALDATELAATVRRLAGRP